MAGGEILANIVLSGDEAAASGFDEIGDSMSESAGEAGIFSAALGSVANQLSDTIAPARLAASSIDETGDEAQEAGAQAAMASGSAGLFSTALLGMGTAGALASSSLSGVAVSIGAVTLALAPLLPALGLAVGALGGLAAAFGAILGSGLLAFNEQTKGLKKTLADLQSQLKPLIVSFGSQFIPLIRDGLNAVVPFVKALLDAVGNLKPFTSALRALGGAAFKIIPQMLSLFVSVARQALPAFTKLGTFIANNLVPALSALFAAGQRAAGPVTRVAMAIAGFGQSLMGVAGWVGRFAVSLYNLAGAAAGIGNLNKALARVGTVAKQGIIAARDAIVKGMVGILTSFNLLPNAVAMAISDVINTITSGVSAILLSLLGFGKKAKEQWGYAMASLELLTQTYIPRIVSYLGKKIRQGVKFAFNWVRTKGVSLAKQALRLMATGAVAAFKFGKNQLLPAVRRGVAAAWNWVKTSGVRLAKQALRLMATGAIAAFKFGKNKLLPAIRKGVRQAWNWVKTGGVQLAKQALRLMATGAIAAFKFGKNKLLPAIRKGVRQAWNWVKTGGVQLAKKALRLMAQGAIAAFKIGKKLLPKIKTGIRKGWTWVKGPGAAQGKNAFKVVARRSVKGLKTLQKRAVPVVRTAMTRIGNSIRRASPKLYQAVRGVVNGLSRLWRASTKGWVTTIKKSLALLVDQVRGSLKALPRIIRPILNRLSAFWRQHGKDIALIVGALVAGVSQAVRMMMNVYRRLTKAGTAAVAAIWDAFGKEIIAVVTFITDMTLSVIGGLIDTLATLIRAGMAGINGNWSRAWNLIAGLAERILDGIISFVGKWAGRLQSAVSGAVSAAWQRIHKFGVDSLNAVKNFFGGIVDYIRNDFWGDLVSAAKGAAKAAVSGLKSAFNGALPNNIKVPKIKIGGGKIPGTNKHLPSASIGGQKLKVPKLASGGVATGPTLAMIGEGGEDEAVLPLSKLDGMLSRSSARRSGTAGGGGTVVIDQTIESGAFQGVGLDEVRDLATQTFDEWMDEIKREIQAQRTQ